MVARKGRFFFGRGDRPVRFWGVNGPAATTPGELRREARTLAKYGVNLVRFHLEVFDARGEPDAKKIARAHEVVAAMKEEGIYTHLSIFFPLDWRPPADLAWLPGYDGSTSAHAAIFFSRPLTERYQSWWRRLLESRPPGGGARLRDDPAVFGAELVNEDSLLFWTFDPGRLPGPQLAALEAEFAAWLLARFGSLAQARARWGAVASPRDRLPEGRLGLRPLATMLAENTERDRDTLRFLADLQQRFYAEQVAFLRGLGFRGVVTASNWMTADARRLGPLEQRSYLPGDFIDRHAYFSCGLRGPDADWSLRVGQLYTDRSALKFERALAAEPHSVTTPLMDLGVDDKPTMLSEVSWNRPNRHRSEAPLLLASYGALLDRDAIVHFSDDGVDWKVKPRHFMQPWTLASPALMAQFPAAALLYRTGLVAESEVVAEVTLVEDELFKSGGTPLPLEAPFDESARKEVGPHDDRPLVASDLRIDPLVHYVGRTVVRFGAQPRPPALAPLAGHIRRRAGAVHSSTGELRLDYRHGVLRITAPRAQGALGNLAAAGPITLPDVTVACPLDVAHVIVVSLDGAPIATARRMLLQVMTEERPRGFRSEAAGVDGRRIMELGTEPWLFRAPAGTVRFKRADAASLEVEALDQLGMPKRRLGSGEAIVLDPETIYYLVTAR